MSENKKISLILNRQQQEILNCLLGSGLHGRTLPEAVRRLMDRELQQYFAMPSLTVKGKAKP